MKFLIISLLIALTTTSDINFYKLHYKEERYILNHNLNNAIDLRVIHHGHIDGNGDATVCNVIQRGIDLQTQDIELIKPDQFQDADFNPDTPINIRQFVAMVHIRDGIIALSSDNVIFMLKFKYTELHDDTLYEPDQDLQPQFASLVWKADIGQIGLSQKALTQIPQLVYSFEYNFIMLIYSDSASIMSVTEMEENSNKANVRWFPELVARKERGWTKCLGSLLVSAVGGEGIDVYEVSSATEQRFIANIQSDRLWPDGGNQGLLVEDIQLLKCEKVGDQQCYLLYFIDQRRGINIVKLLLTQKHELFYHILMENIGNLNNGVSMDTYDGKTIIASYNNLSKWIVQEIRVNLDQQTWDIVSTYHQRTRVIDVGINEDLAVIEGISHQQLLFYGQNEKYKTFQRSNPMSLNYGNMRDFQFFKQSHMEDPSIAEKIQKGMKDGRIFDDFFFGVTKHKLFVTRYQVTSPSLICYTEDPQQIGKTYLYTAIYNTTSCPFLYDTSINCQQSQTFRVQVVSTILFSDKIFLVSMFLVLMGLSFVGLFIFFFLLFKRFRSSTQDLEVQISQVIKTPQQAGGMIEIVNQSMSVDVSKQNI